MIKNNTLNFKSDISSGLVVFLIALPLCLGISQASDAPFISGLISGIVGGVVVGFLSGSKLSVSGPAAGLTVIVSSAITLLNSFESFLLAVLFAGILQLILGYVRAGIVSHYFPSAVIKGMLSAIGIILILKQIPHAVGYDKDYEGDLSFMQKDGENTFSELLNAFGYFEKGAIIIFIISLLILLIWENKLFKKYSFFKFFPGGLCVVLLGVVMNQIFNTFIPSLFLDDSTHLVTMGAESGIMSFFEKLRFPDFSQWNNSNVYIVAVTIALVASIETLLCIEAVDKLDPQKNITSTNRELKAQGIGNMVCGMFGGLPITSVIVRSSANLDSGAKSKFSAIFHGILLFVAVVFIPKYINLIPLASLAAILIVVGYKLAKISIFKQMYRLGLKQFLPYVITILAILFTDLLTGIGIGMVVSVFYILKNNYDFPFSYVKSNDNKEVDIVLAENVTFINKGNILKTLRSIKDGMKVTIDASANNNIDHDVKEVIQNFLVAAKHRNIEIIVKGMEQWKNHSIY